MLTRYFYPAAARNSLTVSLLLFMFAFVGLAGCSEEQEGGDPVPGDTTDVGEITAPEGSIVYELITDMEQSMSMQGTDMSGTMRGEGTLTLTKLEENEKGVVWQAKSDQLMSGEMMGQTLNKTPQEQTMLYTLSPSGEIVDVSIKGIDEKLAAGIQQVLQNASNRQNGMQLFLTEAWLEKKEGETWTDRVRDTVDVKGIKLDQNSGAEGDIYMVMDIPTTYTFEGIVDTLGQKTARLSYEIQGMTMSGTVTMSGDQEAGIEFSNQSNGTGRFYYSMVDRLQVAGTSVTHADSRLSIPMQGEMPMKQTITTTMTRK